MSRELSRDESSRSLAVHWTNPLLSRICSNALPYAIAKEKIDSDQADSHYQDGCELYEKKEYDEAIERFVMAAELGHCEAQIKLAQIFLEGIPDQEVDFVDHRRAFAWYERAAAQGSTHAQLKLGWMCEAGLGHPKDSRRAVYWYRLAAEAGNPDAQFNIGVKYDNGEGVEHNPEEAVRWFTMAAEQGHADARYFLGQAYEIGDGVEKDIQEALDWYILAIEVGQSAARRRF